MSCKASVIHFDDSEDLCQFIHQIKFAKKHLHPEKTYFKYECDIILFSIYYLACPEWLGATDACLRRGKGKGQKENRRGKRRKNGDLKIF